MAARVRIKAGAVEFEYEGEAEFSLDDLKEVFGYMETLFKVPLVAESAQAYSAPDGAPAGNGAPTPSAPGQKLHINSVAQKLGSKTPQDLAVAAAATLQLMEGEEKFTRDELLETMKKATMHYNKNMRKNLTRTLNSLVGSKLNQVSDGVYSLNSNIYQELASKLA